MDKFASKSMIPLKGLALVDCRFPLGASSLVEAFRASEAKELKYNGVGPEDGELRELKELEVSVTYVGPTSPWA